MFNYHSSLASTHPSASEWFTWAFIIKPVLLLRTYLPNDIVSVIYAMGNPAVWWVGFSFILLSFISAIKKDFICIFITAFFFFQWIPFAFISRTTYLYHFYSNVPFLCLATAYFVNKYWNNKLVKIIAIIYFALVVFLFGFFYPVISGIPTPTSRFDGLIWLESWIMY
jgi:dolichyl-phosphate-mannose--protein O-mannosyl transferase